MKWYTFIALIGAFVFVGALAIEGLAIWRLGRAVRKEEREMWVATQDRLKFLAAPSGSLLMTLMVIGIVNSQAWSTTSILWLYGALLAFLVVVILSSTWTPRRFKQIGLSYRGKPNMALDPTLAALWVVRVLLLVGVLFAGIMLY